MQTEQPAETPTHYVIVADLKSGSIHGLEAEIFRLGKAEPIAPQVWILSATYSLAAVRNLLVQKTGRLDQLVIVDASHDRIMYVNYGPSVEARIRQIWPNPQTRNPASAGQ